MKGIIIVLFVAAVLGTVMVCKQHEKEPEHITGFVVAKEFIPKHWDNEQNPKSISCSAVFVPFVPHVSTANHTPIEIGDQWVIYVANRYEVYPKWTSKSFFKKVKLGQFITVKK